MDAASTGAPVQLFQMASGVVLQQSLYAAARLGLADLLDSNPRAASELAGQLDLDGSALLRVMRLLASHGVFEERAPGVFANSALSNFLRTGVPGSLRSLVILRGSEFFAPFGEILYSIQTGLPAIEKIYGKSTFEHLKEHPENARIFDDAMTNISGMLGPAIAAAYDFGAWGSLMDLGGGNGMLLSFILKDHPRLYGVLADLPHVLARAKERSYLSGELEARSKMHACDIFEEVPCGCRAYLMKNVIHDWDDERAGRILANCRRVVPNDGALLLAEWALNDDDSPSPGRYMDIAMMVLTGGKERNVDQYRELLAGAGFHLSRVVPVPGDFSLIEAVPV